MIWNNHFNSKPLTFHWPSSPRCLRTSLCAVGHPRMADGPCRTLPSSQGPQRGAARAGCPTRVRFCRVLPRPTASLFPGLRSTSAWSYAPSRSLRITCYGECWALTCVSWPQDKSYCPGIFGTFSCLTVYLPWLQTPAIPCNQNKCD